MIALQKTWVANVNKLWLASPMWSCP